MVRLSALLFLALVACGSDAADPCQQACDLVKGPGTLAVSCDQTPGPTAPSDYGTCLCTADGRCPSGWYPHRG